MCPVCWKLVGAPIIDLSILRRVRCACAAGWTQHANHCSHISLPVVAISVRLSPHCLSLITRKPETRNCSLLNILIYFIDFCLILEIKSKILSFVYERRVLSVDLACTDSDVCMTSISCNKKQWLLKWCLNKYRTNT